MVGAHGLPLLAVAVAALLLFAGGCGGVAGEPVAQQASPILGGEADDRDFSVAALLHDDVAYCTGTLVSPRIVLTAAHCLLGPRPEQVAFGRAPNAPDAERRRVASVRVDPRFDPATLAHDVGVVLLVDAASREPVRLLEPTGAPPVKGEQVRLVGFGWTNPAGADAPAERRDGAARIDAIDDEELTFHAAPAQTCRGDSGGPALVRRDDAEYVIGVASSGARDCASLARDVRVDGARGAFVRAAIEDLDPPPIPRRAGGCAIGRTDEGARGTGVVLGALGLLGLGRSSRRRGRARLPLARGPG